MYSALAEAPTEAIAGASAYDAPVNLSLPHLDAALRSRRPEPSPLLSATRRAAVAALLRYSTPNAPEVLLMKRATHPKDRWSGQVSFPGGREEDGDVDLTQTAIRETREEVGIDLRRSARLLGRLDRVRAVARGKVLPMSITPFVFAQTREVEVELSDEAEDTFWLPLKAAASGTLDGTYRWQKGPVSKTLPCWRYEGRVVWGLTYGMLQSLLALGRPR